ncbi:MAG: hypothetical protein ACLQNE_33840 [Thermoguttaceae bacterium]
MFSAMLRKEVRETMLLGMLALIVYACLLMTGMGLHVNPFESALPSCFTETFDNLPFLNGADDSFLCGVAYVSAVLAVALGFRQTLGESIQGTYVFLLHRPASRGRLIGLKLLSGAGVYLVCSAIPILAYAAWAATPGTHAGPFFWSMTLPAWGTWWAITPLYLGAFLSRIRPAPWYRSRLAPLVAAGAAVSGLLWNEQMSCFVAGGSSTVGVVAILVVDAVLVAGIVHTARNRDY